MIKNSSNTTLNYSPNFDRKKRKFSQIKFLIFHYTGMKREKDAIKRLTSDKSKVSSHYFIKKNGEILNLIPEKFTAWHAGISFWRNYKSMNKYSIGIEISNPGHDIKYKNFSKKQIQSIVKLSKYLIKKYNIHPRFLLGHSDISPDRKKDPGEKFPWKYLANRKIGYWHQLRKNTILKERRKKVLVLDKHKFINNLYKIGYSRKIVRDKRQLSKILTIAFQRRFRQELVDGIIDRECLIISENLAKKI
tara:strand:- start:90 stop:833 length:744 start_codon:yes stop_codon:yes gene_type:complete